MANEFKFIVLFSLERGCVCLYNNPFIWTMLESDSFIPEFSRENDEGPPKWKMDLVLYRDLLIHDSKIVSKHWFHDC